MRNLFCRKTGWLPATVIAAVVFMLFPALVFPADPPNPVDTIVEGWLDFVQEEGAPGAIVHISTPSWEGTWTRGTADLETGRPIASDNTFRIASISKTFTATVVLQMADEGRLSLDDTLNEFNGGFGIPNAEQITVRQLLNHTSGISDWADSTAARDKLCSVPPSQAPLLNYTPQEMVDMAISNGPYFPPGGGWSYSNTNYVLLGMMVEWLTHSEVTGTYLGPEIERRIIEPLELEDTYYPADSGIYPALFWKCHRSAGSGRLQWKRSQRYWHFPERFRSLGDPGNKPGVFWCFQGYSGDQVSEGRSLTPFARTREEGRETIVRILKMPSILILCAQGEYLYGSCPGINNPPPIHHSSFSLLISMVSPK